MEARRWKLVVVVLAAGLRLAPAGQGQAGAGGSLSVAAARGDKVAVEKLLAEGADVHAGGPLLGGSPLHWAARLGRRDVAELLLSSGADVNARAPSRQTPVHWAALHADADTVEFLMARGAHIQPVDRHGKTPEQLAAQCGRTEMAALLRERAHQAYGDVSRWQRSVTVGRWPRGRKPTPTLVELDIPWYCKALAVLMLAGASGGGGGVAPGRVKIHKAALAKAVGKARISR